jgi:hypothetical protein
LHASLYRCLRGETQVQKIAPLAAKKSRQLSNIRCNPSRLKIKKSGAEKSPKKRPEIRFGEPMQHFGLAR